MKTKLLLLFLGFSGLINAQIIQFPDQNFKKKLLSANSTNTVATIGSGYTSIDSNNDGEIDVNEAALIEALEITDANITDLTGIEYFTKMWSLDCSNNQLESLNLEKLCNLLSISANNNKLKFFKFCKVFSSEGGIYLANNLFEQLDLSNFGYDDGHDVFNLSNNPNLIYLNLKNGYGFNACDPTYEPVNVDCLNNITFNGCNALRYICIDGDDTAVVNYHLKKMGLENITQISTDCSFGGTITTMSTKDFVNENAVKWYPNPTNGIVNFTNKEQIEKIELFDIQGRLLQTQNGDALQNQLDIQQHPNGIYLIKVTTPAGLYTDQLIKQ